MSSTPLIMFTVRSFSNEAKRLMHAKKMHRDDSITGMQYGVIDYVGGHSGGQDLFQKDIEYVFNIRRSTATGILQLMEKNGLIQREPVAHDARLKKIVLTEKAKAVYSAANKAMLSIESKVVKGLTKEEVDAFLRIINKMIDNMKE